jgi:phenylacetaldehyde dehydrogenase
MQAAKAVADSGTASFFARARNNLIGSAWVPAASGKTIAVADPSTGAVLMNTPDSASEDVSRAVAAARRAFDTGPWPRLTPFERAKILRRFADLVDKNAEELARIESIDAGKPINQARYVDVPLTLHQLHFYAGLCASLSGRTITPSCPYMPDTKFHAYTLRQPLGVAALITPFNFPLLLGTMKVAPALAAGCTIILKPDERAPGSSLRLGELALEAGVPEGVFNIVTGGPATGQLLAAHPQIDKIAFTGSGEAARDVLARAAGNLKKVSLELGGNAPNIIFKDADLAAAVAGAGAGAYTNSGEVCVGGARLFVEEAVYDQVMSGLVKFANGLKLGPAIEETTTMGPIITREHLEKVAGAIEAGKASGGTVVTGGSVLPGPGFFLQPTIVTDVAPSTPFMAEETFGPVLKVQRFKDVEQLVASANDTPYGLAAGFWTRDVSKAHQVAAALKAGTVWVNCYNVFDTALPFGGYKESGWGRESCPEALELYTEVKTVCIAL